MLAERAAEESRGYSTGSATGKVPTTSYVRHGRQGRTSPPNERHPPAFPAPPPTPGWLVGWLVGGLCQLNYLFFDDGHLRWQGFHPAYSNERGDVNEGRVGLKMTSRKLNSSWKIVEFISSQLCLAMMKRCPVRLLLLGEAGHPIKRLRRMYHLAEDFLHLACYWGGERERSKSTRKLHQTSETC